MSLRATLSAEGNQALDRLLAGGKFLTTEWGKELADIRKTYPAKVTKKRA